MADDEIVLQAANWTVTEVAQPLEGALHHWRLIPHCPSLEGVVGLSSAAQDELWHVLNWLANSYQLTYWCMGSRSWEGGVVHVLVGDPSSTTVRFEMGLPSDSKEMLLHPADVQVVRNAPPDDRGVER